MYCINLVPARLMNLGCAQEAVLKAPLDMQTSGRQLGAAVAGDANYIAYHVSSTSHYAHQLTRLVGSD